MGLYLRAISWRAMLYAAGMALVFVVSIFLIPPSTSSLTSFGQGGALTKQMTVRPA